MIFIIAQCEEYQMVNQGDIEEVACETVPEDNLLRNGLGDDSYFIWSDRVIPYVINEGFNETNKQNIQEAIDEYNRLFKGCLTWKPKTDEVRKLVQSLIYKYYHMYSQHVSLEVSTFKMITVDLAG